MTRPGHNQLGTNHFHRWSTSMRPEPSGRACGSRCHPRKPRPAHLSMT